MPRKAFRVQVELHVQAVSCPGVWLCPNGKLSLQIHMLGSSIQTHCAEPVFPIVLDEKFVFSRSYYDVGKLGTLQKIFNKDTLYIELIQWQNCENGNVLATFQTTLGELLYPESRKQSLGNSEVDLLMETMKNFPGILAPKIEVSTKTTIQDEVCPSTEDLETQVLCNPNIVSSNNPQRLAIKCGLEHGQIQRQKPVCHTRRCHNLKCAGANNLTQNTTRSNETRPPFIVRKVPEDLKYYCQCKECKEERSAEHNQTHTIDKQNQSKPRVIHTKNSCVQRIPSPRTERNANECCKSKVCVNRDTSPIRWTKSKVCECGEHHSDNCLVCAKYKHYFGSRSIKSQKRQENKCESVNCVCPQPVATNDAILCNYPASPQLYSREPSIAQKLHTRLKETLNRCVDCQETVNNNCACGDCGDYMRDCATGSLSHFYKKLYTCSNKCS